jgi:DNA-binding XRE family transcriptional regulator
MRSSEFYHYTRDEFLAEFYPDPADKAAIAAGMEQLRAEQRAFRLAEMRRRLGITQVQVAARMGITQGRVSAIERCSPSLREGRGSGGSAPVRDRLLRSFRAARLRAVAQVRW